MAYRRCLLQRGSNLIDRRCHPSFSYVLHSDDAKRDQPDDKPSLAGISNSFIQTRSFGSSFNGSMGFFSGFRHKELYPFAGYSFCRNMSTMDQNSDKITVMTDVADVLTDTAMETVTSQAAPVVSEVAIAAADSYLPVQALQYFIDAVHSYTGLNWWAAIALTTLLIRTATVPLLINQLKTTSKLTLMRPHLEAIKEEMDGKTFDPEAVAEGQKRMKKLFKEYGVSPLSPLKGLFIQGPVFISFFLAINNMSEKMPSFKHGGAFWFTDLTTPDALYVFPVLAALSFLVVVECNMQEGMEGNPMGDTMKKFSRILAFLTVPFTMTFPKEKMDIHGPQHFDLNTGAKIPAIGLGTWKASPGVVGHAVVSAVKAGYRHIDCARVYDNEKEVGEALKTLFSTGVVERSEMFITSKLWVSDCAPEDVSKALTKTLEDLQLDYIDLYLIHWPFRTKSGSKGWDPEVMAPLCLSETWNAMEGLFASGQARAIGVSNFSTKKLQDLLKYAKIPPAVNQVECHPVWQQPALHNFCMSTGVHLTAYSPLGSPGSWVKGEILKEPILIEIAEKLNKSPAQVALRWGLQSGHSVLPKSVNESRIKENLSLFDWCIPPEFFSKFSQIHQQRLLRGDFAVHETCSPYKSLEDLWDGEI